MPFSNFFLRQDKIHPKCIENEIVYYTDHK